MGLDPPGLEHSPIVSVHLLFDRPLLRHRLAALLDSPAHWVFDRGALTGHEPPDGGQYLTVVSAGCPDLLEVRGRDLVDTMADALRERLGGRLSSSGRASAASRVRLSPPGPGRVAFGGRWSPPGRTPTCRRLGCVGLASDDGAAVRSASPRARAEEADRRE